MRFISFLFVPAVLASATAKKAHPFEVEATIFANSDCTGTNQTLTVSAEACANANFDFSSASIRVKPRYRHDINKYALFYWYLPDCSTPNRQGYLRGQITAKSQCQFAGSDYGVDHSILILRANETGDL